MLVLVETGTRISELLDLRWSDVDLHSATCVVYRAKTGTQFYIPLSDTAQTVLKRRTDAGYFRPFYSMGSAIIQLRKALHEVCDNDKDFVKTRGAATIHSLRDTFATRFAKRGMSLQTLARLLGHTTEAMAEKYGHLESEDVLDLVRMFMQKPTDAQQSERRRTETR